MAAILDQDRLRLQRSFRSAVGIAKAAMDLAGDGRTNSQKGTRFEAFGRSVEFLQAGTRGSDGESSSMPTVKVSVETKLAFWEVLSYWELLEDDEIEKAFVEALGQVAWRNVPAWVCASLWVFYLMGSMEAGMLKIWNYCYNRDEFTAYPKLFFQSCCYAGGNIYQVNGCSSFASS